MDYNWKVAVRDVAPQRLESLNVERGKVKGAKVKGVKVAVERAIAEQGCSATLGALCVSVVQIWWQVGR